LPQTCFTIDELSYEIWYQPITQGAPDLPSSGVIPIEGPVSIEPCEPGGACPGETISEIEFVSMATKQLLEDFLAANPSVTQLEYNIFYRFFGENGLGEGVSADGATFFYAANYDHCGY
jgi:hypothetical protein